MAKKKDEEKEATKVGEDVKVDQTELQIPKDAIVDSLVWVISLDGDVHHKTGDEFQMGRKTALMMQDLGRVKIKE
jgi:hypothetical protein